MGGSTTPAAKASEKAGGKAGGPVAPPVHSGKPGGGGSAKTAAKTPVGAPKPAGSSLTKKGGGPVLVGPSAKGAASGAPAVAPSPGGSKGAGAQGSGKGTGGKASKKAVPEAPPRPAVPRKFPKGGPGKAELRKYRAHLLELRRGLLASSKDLAAEALKSSSSEFTVDRTPDSGADNYEQDFSLQLLEGEAAQLADIREALLKIDGKIELPFGICEACSDTDKRLCETCPWIPPSRLDVMPHARLCVQTKEIEERKKQR